MKKRLIALLTACVMAGFTTLTALGVNDYYPIYGDIENWTEQQYAEAENWTDEEWDLYGEQYNANHPELNASDETPIAVIYNDEEVAFSDAYPMIVQDRTMVPFRAIFETMGATVSYEDATRSITAVFSQMNRTVKLTVGSTVITVEENGQAHTLQMDVAPFVNEATNRTFVPVRFISESVGFDVFWSGFERVVTIIDQETLISGIDKDFTILNRWLADNRTDMEKTYQNGVDVQLGLTMYGENKNDTATLRGSMDFVNQGLNISGSGTIQVNVDDFSSSLLYGLNEEQTAILKQLSNVPFQMIVNPQEGNLYLQCDAIAELDKSGAVSKGNWVVMDDRTLNGMMAMMTAMMENGRASTIGSTLYESAKIVREEQYGYGHYLIYEDVKTLAESYRLFMADSCFTQTGNSYTMKMNRETLIENMVALVISQMGEPDTAEAQAIQQQMIDLVRRQFDLFSAFDLNVTLTENGGKLSHCALNGNMTVQTSVPLEISISVEGSANASKAVFALKGRYVGKVEATMTARTTETDATVQTAPPQGAFMVDYDTYFGAEYDYVDGKELTLGEMLDILQQKGTALTMDDLSEYTHEWSRNGTDYTATFYVAETPLVLEIVGYTVDVLPTEVMLTNWYNGDSIDPRASDVVTFVAQQDVEGYVE